MIENLKHWLASHFEIAYSDTESYFRNENVTGFLVMWSILEKKLFNGFLRFKDLKGFSENYSKNWNDNLEIEFQYFHDRYQNKEFLRNLMHQDGYKEIMDIIGSEKSKITTNQKMLFILYVVYRYRNNIFHGTKGVESWIKYKFQIEKCVNVMIEILSKVEAKSNE